MQHCVSFISKEVGNFLILFVENYAEIVDSNVFTVQWVL